MKKVFILMLLLVSFSAYTQKAFRVKVYGKGEPVILISGFACSGDVWNETAKNLQDHYQLYVITIAGFAGVPPIDTPVLATVKNELIKYVKNKRLNKPILIGHSLGAFMCLWMASEEPSMFSKILCVDGVPFISAIMNPSATVEQVKNNPAYKSETMLNNFQKLSATDFENSQFKAMQNMVSDTAHARLIARWSAASDRKTLAYTYVEMATTDLRNNIADIRIPVLVLGSIYGTKEASQKILNDQYSQLPNKTIIIAPAKHFIMYDDPAWFKSQVNNFLINGLSD